MDIRYRTADVDGFTVFYREAGAPDAPTLILLHGFPSASHQFRELIPLLADRLHLVAPDLPGFGGPRVPRPDRSLLLRVEVGQQAERALEDLRRDQAGGQLLVDLQAGQHRLADGPDLDGRGFRGRLVSIGVG
jgi:pimeloyl-ACP methyl ester carboxylesterase